VVAVIGLLIPLLSVGGIYLWWKKRGARNTVRALAAEGVR
jgi:uncharacterized iron-regulated membrane protein